MIEANEFYLPLAGDTERHAFYEAGLRAAIEASRDEGSGQRPTVLDCSGSGGVPALLAAKQHGLQALVLTQRAEFKRALRLVAKDNGVEELVQVHAADPRDLIEAMLPGGLRVDVVVVDPPGTPMHSMSPFAVLPAIRKYLLKEGGRVVPAGGCLRVRLLDSVDLAQMFYVPGGRWEEVDLSVWNMEAHRQGVLERLVPYTKWFGAHSTMNTTWLSEPRCVFEVDLNDYGGAAPSPEQVRVHELPIVADGRAHALVAEWEVWAEPGRRGRLGARADTWAGR